MAGRLSVFFRMLYLGAMFGVAGLVHGQDAGRPSGDSLPDPTRPPAILAEPAPADEGKSDKAEKAAPAGLQTVIMRKGEKPLAVINGQTVQLGGMVGEARLVKLNESEAVLQGPNGMEMLHLTPGVERKAIIPPLEATVKPGPKKKMKPKLTK